MKQLFVANWKMRMNSQDAIQYCSNNLVQLNELASKNAQIILCPSFIAIQQINSLLRNTRILIGAQDCSAFNQGPYTGQISAQDLAQSGCTYCIVGHSERRLYCAETDEIIAKKTVCLIENNITPIICIGENSAECILTTTYATLEKQLQLIFSALKNHTIKPIEIIIAYEPIWAIESDTIPTKSYITSVFEWLHTTITEQISLNRVNLIYGGSVNKKTITQIQHIPHLSGFLIGSASIDPEEFKSIIKSCRS